MSVPSITQYVMDNYAKHNGDYNEQKPNYEPIPNGN